ncbi:MAG: rRNA pseudouridine synthase [Chlamydiia bacterium]|nr:rRNA pseudouridine synthase [Chlamydiia bacterium]
MKQRIAKILASRGAGSRRKMEALVLEGRVKVNGRSVVDLAFRLNPSHDGITIDDKPLPLPSERKIFLLNKPKGYHCTSKRPHPNAKLVLDLFKRSEDHLFTVGRLDKETSGLLLVTNDGQFAHNVAHPSMGITKEYLVKVAGEIGPVQLQQISAGMMIDGIKITPLKVKKVRRGTLKILLNEGRKREIRHLIAHAELPLKELIRIRIGSLHLGSLPQGAYRSLSNQEINELIQ